MLNSNITRTKKFNFNKQDSAGKTLLMKTVSKSSVSEVYKLLENDADPNIRDIYGNNALNYAAQQTSSECLEQQIPCIQNLNYQNAVGHSPLMLAVLAKSESCVIALIESGVNIDLPSQNGFTALMYAVENDNVDIAQILIDSGADVNYQNWAGETPLILCAKLGLSSCLQMLLEHRAYVDMRDNLGKTALLHACLYEAANKEICQAIDPDQLCSFLLIDKNANATIEDLEGNGPVKLFFNDHADLFTAVQQFPKK